MYRVGSRFEISVDINTKPAVYMLTRSPVDPSQGYLINTTSGEPWSSRHIDLEKNQEATRAGIESAIWWQWDSLELINWGQI